MASEVNHAITGERNYIGKSIIYGDTDSCYFSAYPTLKRAIVNGEIEWTKESVIELYDNIASIVNATFSSFMTSAFNCPPERGNVIQAGREIVGSKALFIKKKRYAVLVYDKDGKRLDVKDKTGKIKAMGLDLKRADTPVFIQKFLSTILEMVLSDASEREVLEYIKRFRTQFKPMEGWNIGSPKRVNNLAKYRDKEQADGKANLPGHVRASLNWNTLRDIFNDKHIPAITDGSKVIVCKLKPNQYGFTSIAYPIDETHLPDWFLELPFDNDEMESVLIDKKIDNLIGVLQYDLGNTHETPLFDQFFSSE
jgi:hypothetical protein